MNKNITYQETTKKVCPKATPMRSDAGMVCFSHSPKGYSRFPRIASLLVVSEALASASSSRFALEKKRAVTQLIGIIKMGS